MRKIKSDRVAKKLTPQASKLLIGTLVSAGLCVGSIFVDKNNLKQLNDIVDDYTNDNSQIIEYEIKKYENELSEKLDSGELTYSEYLKRKCQMDKSDIVMGYFENNADAESVKKANTAANTAFGSILTAIASGCTTVACGLSFGIGAVSGENIQTVDEKEKEL